MIPTVYQGTVTFSTEIYMKLKATRDIILKISSVTTGPFPYSSLSNMQRLANTLIISPFSGEEKTIGLQKMRVKTSNLKHIMEKNMRESIQVMQNLLGSLILAV